MKNISFTRRDFIRGGVATGAALAFPSIIPSTVLGRTAPSQKITIGVVGCGRIAQSFNIPGCLSDGGRDLCDFIAVCDVDPDRRNHYKRMLATEKFQGRDLVAPSRWSARRSIRSAVSGTSTASATSPGPTLRARS